MATANRNREIRMDEVSGNAMKYFFVQRTMTKTVASMQFFFLPLFERNLPLLPLGWAGLVDKKNQNSCL